MRRAAPIIVATVGTIGLLASFHTTPGVATKTRALAPASHRSAATAPPPGQESTSATAPPPGQGSPGQGSTSTTGAKAAGSTAKRQVDGPVVSNQFGDVQVRVTVAGSKLTDVTALQLPFDRERSAQISQLAEPELRREALQAQSASIDLLSGATYTSDSYAQSLQGALDQVGLGSANSTGP